MEDEMELIQDGKLDKDEVIKEGKEILTQLLDKWKKNETQIGNDLAEALKLTQYQQNIIGPCDKCGKQLRIIRMRDKRQFVGCTGYPNCRNAYPLPPGSYVQASGKLCPACNKPTINVKKVRTRYTMCIDPNCPSKADWKKGASAANKTEAAKTSEAPATKPKRAKRDKNEENSEL